MRFEIQKAMEEQGISAAELALKSGIEKVSFTEYMDYKKELLSNELEKIFEVLGSRLPSSDEMAEMPEWSGGCLFQRMISEIPLRDCLPENKCISRVGLASYLMGMFAARIANKTKRSNTLSVLDNIVFQENYKKPFLFNRSIVKMGLQAECFSEYEKLLFAHLCFAIRGLNTDEAENDSFLAAFFRYKNKG